MEKMDEVERCLSDKCKAFRVASTEMMIDLAYKYKDRLNEIHEQRAANKITEHQFYKAYDNVVKEAMKDKRYIAYNNCARFKCSKAFENYVIELIELCKLDEVWNDYVSYFTVVLKKIRSNANKDKSIITLQKEIPDLVHTLKTMRRFATYQSIKHYKSR